MDDAVDHMTSKMPVPDYSYRESVHYWSDDGCAVDSLRQLPPHWLCASCDADAFPDCFVGDTRDFHVAHMPAAHAAHCCFDADDCGTCFGDSTLHTDDFGLSRGRDTAAAADCGRANCDRLRSVVGRLLVDWLGQRSDGWLAHCCCRGEFEGIRETVLEGAVTMKGADRQQSV